MLRWARNIAITIGALLACTLVFSATALLHMPPAAGGTLATALFAWIVYRFVVRH